MAEVMDLIERIRVRNRVSKEFFAHQVGITAATYSRQINGRHGLGLDSIQAYAKYAHATKNIELLRVLAAYALAMEPDQIVINPSK